MEEKIVINLNKAKMLNESGALIRFGAKINRMLYYMFDATKGDLPSLLSQYDVDVDLTEDGKLKNVNLIILEPETSDE